MAKQRPSETASIAHASAKMGCGYNILAGELHRMGFEPDHIENEIAYFKVEDLERAMMALEDAGRVPRRTLHIPAQAVIITPAAIQR